ncbi:MAG: acyloxyacyl hydrolase [Sphingomicrobium sp.]
MHHSLTLAAAAAALAFTVAAPAQAAEVFAGAYIHDVDTPLTFSGVEKGVDVQAGVRGGRIGATPLQPYAFIAVNTSGATSYGAVGLSARFGHRLYVRPGLGLALHNGSTRNFNLPGNGKIEFGSRILFEPELAVGMEIAPRTSIEASWVHMSHATLFSRQNPGIDNFGLRLNFAL